MSSVPPPTVDPLDVVDEPVSPRPLPDLVAGVMEMRSCPKPRAKRYVEDVGPERVENELRARWTANGEQTEDSDQ